MRLGDFRRYRAHHDAIVMHCSAGKTCMAALFFNKLLRSHYSGRTRTITLMSMPCLFTSPSHQQPYYWLHDITSFLISMMMDFNHFCLLIVRNYIRLKYIISFTQEHPVRTELKSYFYLFLCTSFFSMYISGKIRPRNMFKQYIRGVLFLGGAPWDSIWSRLEAGCVYFCL